MVGTSSVSNLSFGSSIVQILFYLCFIVYCHYLLCLSFIVTITLMSKVCCEPQLVGDCICVFTDFNF